MKCAYSEMPLMPETTGLVFQVLAGILSSESEWENTLLSSWVAGSVLASCGTETPPYYKVYYGNIGGREGMGAGILEGSYFSAALPSNRDSSFYLCSGYFKTLFLINFFPVWFLNKFLLTILNWYLPFFKKKNLFSFFFVFSSLFS